MHVPRGRPVVTQLLAPVGLLSLLGFVAPAWAADLAVTNANDSGGGSLRQAILDVNSAGAGSHSITFDSNLDPIQLDSDLPPILGTDQSITITGNSNVIDGQSQGAIFFVGSGSVAINQLDLKRGHAVGGAGGDSGQYGGGGGGGLGAGGALFVNEGASVTLNNVHFEENRATGGAGGSDGSPGRYGGGGGGGFRGTGGSSGEYGGGGGGGFGGHGGAGAPTQGSTGYAGGGGGGLSSNGGDGVATTGGAGTVEGGAGGSLSGNSADGQQYGGGGGGGYPGDGGAGGDFGGGGGGAHVHNGGGAGFGGGGGGGGYTAAAGSAGFGGGNGGSGSGAHSRGGDGGHAYGGAIFVREGGSLTVVDSAISGSEVAAGAGGTGAANGSNGSSAGAGIYLHTGVDVQMSATSTDSYSWSDPISGPGGLTKTGDGRLELTGENDYAGGTTVSGGTLAGSTSSLQGDITNNAAVEFDQSSDGTYAGAMSGTGNLTKTGTGQLTLSGSNTHSGQTAVNQGTLVVDGSVAGDVTVANGATLGGSGFIGRLLLSGTLAPGNSIGTTTISGDATFQSGSTTQIEINDAGTTPGVHNDSLDAAGDVTINGGAVEVVAEAGDYTHGTTYTFVQANSISGTFDSIADNLAFFDAALVYHADSVQFQLIANMSDFAAVAATPNQLAVGEYIDHFSQGAPAELQTVIDALTPLTNDQVHFALNQFSGSVYGTLPTASMQHTSHYLSLLTGRLRGRLQPEGTVSGGRFAPQPAPQVIQDESGEPVLARGQSPSYSERIVWLSGYGLGGVAQSDGNADGFRYGLGGTQFGVETELNDLWNVGAWTNLAWTNLRSDPLNASADVSNYHFGGYAVGYNGRDYMIALGGIGYDDYEVRRQIGAGGISGTSQGSTDGWQANTYFERGLALCRLGWNVQPYGALQYVYLDQRGFTESGSGILDLTVGDIEAHSLRTIVGGRLSRSIAMPQGRVFIPELRASWMHELLDTNQVVNARFQGLGTTNFAVQGLDLGRDWATVGGGYQVWLSPHARAFAGYDVQFNGRQTFHVGSGGLEFLW